MVEFKSYEDKVLITAGVFRILKFEIETVGEMKTFGFEQCIHFQLFALTCIHLQFFVSTCVYLQLFAPTCIHLQLFCPTCIHLLVFAPTCIHLHYTPQDL